MIEVEAAIGVDEKLHVGPDRRAHRAHARGVFANEIGERLRVAPA